MLEKYHKLQLKPNTIDELKAALQTIWKELPQEHINKVVVNFIKRLTANMAVATNGTTSSICSKDVRLQVCILISSPRHQRSGFQGRQLTNILAANTTLGTLRNGGLL